MANKTSWIIGASSGIGEALAIHLAQHDYTVALSARRQSKLQQLQKQMLGNDHLVLDLDCTKVEQLKAASQKIFQNFGKLDQVIFMAGIYWPMSFGKMDLTKTKTMFEVNVLGALNTIETVLKPLLKQGYGQIAICGSVAGYNGLPDSQPYAATKAALINISQSLQVQFGQVLDVKLISPGFVESRLTDKNDFVMPFKLSAPAAAKIIYQGLQKKSFEIHFPKKMSYPLKILQLMPNWLMLKIMRLLIKK